MPRSESKHAVTNGKPTTVRYGKEDRERAIEMVRNGNPITEVARSVGCGPDTIYYWMRKAGVPLPSGLSRRGKIDEKGIGALLECARAVALRYRVTPTTALRGAIRHIERQEERRRSESRSSDRKSEDDEE